MASLKTAANSLLDILYGADDTANQLTVSIVPFVAMVNVGEEDLKLDDGQADAPGVAYEPDQEPGRRNSGNDRRYRQILRPTMRARRRHW